MASKIETSKDRKTYTFTIRDGAKWSNGDPVTAQDFEYAWKWAFTRVNPSKVCRITPPETESFAKPGCSENGSVLI
jgi:ABC-type oligopeptide transport system substrate-binding subunit